MQTPLLVRHALHDTMLIGRALVQGCVSSARFSAPIRRRPAARRLAGGMTLLRRPRRLRRYGLTRPLVILRTSLRRKKRSKVDREKRSWADGFQSCEAARNRQRTAAGGRVLCLVGSRARVDENVIGGGENAIPTTPFRCSPRPSHRIWAAPSCRPRFLWRCARQTRSAPVIRCPCPALSCSHPC